MTIQSTLTESMKALLADSYSLYLKTQNYHWNVVGPHFFSLHLALDGQYKELANAIDTTAELIRGLGEKAPATFKAYQDLSRLKPGNEQASAEEMIKDLLQDHQQMHKILNALLDFAKQANDGAIENFIADRLHVHRQTAWMLESFLS